MYKILREFISRHSSLNRYIDFLYRITEGNHLVYRCRDYTSINSIRVVIKLLVTPFVLIKYLLPVRLCISGSEGLAFVLIAKNEAPYIEEWINFHHKQGVSHFIIYDNESTDNFYEVLKPYIRAGLVSYNLIKGKIRQKDAYNMAIHDYRHKFKYMAFTDADEFVCLRNITGGGTGNLYEFVDEFMTSHKNAGGIAVHWCIFGSNGHITKPEGGVLKNYTLRAEDSFESHQIIKTICDPMKVFSFGHVHFPVYYRGFYNLDETGSIITRSRAKTIHFNKIRINHYFTKSREEYIAKRQRGRADTNTIRLMEDFGYNDKNDIHDTEILGLV